MPLGCGSALDVHLQIVRVLAVHRLLWNKCDGNVWCSLFRVDLTHSHFDKREGVYVVWHGGPNPRTVYVGKGNIRDRLGQHRLDERIRQYAPLGLFTTWAYVDPSRRSGAERYLSNRLGPLVGENWPIEQPVPVNLPWD